MSGKPTACELVSLHLPEWLITISNLSLVTDLEIGDTKAMPHYGDVIMGAIASQITSLTIVYSTVYSDADQRKHQSSASLVFVWGIQRGPVNSPHKWPVTRKLFPFDDVIMKIADSTATIHGTHRIGTSLQTLVFEWLILLCKVVKYSLIVHWWFTNYHHYHHHHHHYHHHYY